MDSFMCACGYDTQMRLHMLFTQALLQLGLGMTTTVPATMHRFMCACVCTCVCEYMSLPAQSESARMDRHMRRLMVRQAEIEQPNFRG